MTIVVEILARDNQVLQHCVLQGDRITIGRAYSSDVRVDDPYVCAEHLQVHQDPDGQIWIEDSTSINGTKINGKIANSGQVSENDVLTLGRTRIRIFNTARTIPATLMLSKLEEKLEWLSNPKICLTLFFGLCLLMSGGYYLSSINEFKLPAFFKFAATAIIAFSVWPFMFALLSKINKKEARIISQFSLLWLTLIVVEIWGHVETLLAGNMGSVSTLSAVSLTSKILVFFAILWLSLFIGFHQSPRSRNRIAFSITAMVLLAMLMPRMFSKDDFNPRPQYNARVLPPFLIFNSSQSTERFIEQSDGLFERVKQTPQAD